MDNSTKKQKPRRARSFSVATIVSLLFALLAVLVSLFTLISVAVFLNSEEAETVRSILGSFLILAFYYFVTFLPIFLLYTLSLVIDVLSHRRMSRGYYICVLINAALFLAIGACLLNLAQLVVLVSGFLSIQLLTSLLLAIGATVPAVTIIFFTRDATKIYLAWRSRRGRTGSEEQTE